MEFENNGRTELSTLGEFGLIEHLTKQVSINHKETILGVGDDAAIIKNNGNTLISTDLLVENVHFDLSYVPLKHLGYKSIIVNLSDIFAMNGSAKQVTVSMALSSKISLEAIEEIYKGMLLACEIYNVDLVGGDTTSSQTGLMISVTAIGEVNADKQTLRSGAKENDLIVVSGDFGGAYMGLQILEREKAVYKENPNVQPDLEGFDYILERQLKPEARQDIIKILNDLEVTPTSMIDVSDGLASELLHISKASNKGITIYEDKLPIDPQTYNTAREFELDPTMCALNGGEDYELLFTIKQEDYDKIKGNPHLTVIGHITEIERGNNMIANGGTSVELKAQGWNHLNK